MIDIGHKLGKFGFSTAFLAADHNNVIMLRFSRTAMSSWKEDLENIGVVEEVSVMFEIQGFREHPH
jgi:hypothetical protein